MNVRIVDVVVIRLPAFATIFIVVSEGGALDERVILLPPSHSLILLRQMLQHLVCSIKRVRGVSLQETFSDVGNVKVPVDGPS